MYSTKRQISFYLIRGGGERKEGSGERDDNIWRNVSILRWVYIYIYSILIVLMVSQVYTDVKT